MTDAATTPVLENWSFALVGDRYSAPESLVPVLQGNVYGHPSMQQGEFISTSRLISYDATADEFICASRNYKLGQVNPEYEKLFPDARQRLINSIQLQETRP